MVEFDSKEDAAVALTRDQKTLDGNTIDVHLGSGATLFVTNFPPTADEAYIRNLFQKVSTMCSYVGLCRAALTLLTVRRDCGRALPVAEVQHPPSILLRAIQVTE